MKNNTLNRDVTEKTERGAEQGPPPPACGSNMGDSVTPHVLMPIPGDWRYLISGIDTLDLGIYVDWGIHFQAIQLQLEHNRDKSIVGETAIWRHPVIGEALVRSSGKRNYRFMVELPGVVLWIANVDKPNGFPNVYVSPRARSLWINGVNNTLEYITSVIEELGGVVQQVQVSRCDLAADFYLEEPLSTEFVKSGLVSKCRTSSQYETAGQLETFYVGRGKAPIQARIYNKLLQVMSKPESLFFLPLWGGPVKAWRVEFQLRRTALRQFQIDTVDDLQAMSGALWKYLTEDWLSLRLDDSNKTNRRTVHPWWQAVADCAETFGPVFDLDRRENKIPVADVDWYVSHVSGCLVSFAARLGLPTVNKALAELDERVANHWGANKWDDEYRKRRIQQGEADEGECDVPF